MSSYLTPVDRERILATIHANLKANEKILLVATSVIECGVDFSFEVGFREKAALMSTIQFAGRVNRNMEDKVSDIYEFSFDDAFIKNSDFTSNPAMNDSILARIGVEVDPDNCTEVIKNEIEMRRKNDKLYPHEEAYRYKTVADDFIVIPNLTSSVVIDKTIIEKIKAGEDVDPVVISRNSISIYKDKIDGKWSEYLEVFNGEEEDGQKPTMHLWIGPYDPELYGAFVVSI
jgi:CRISPR/Cas system-associated endonuclease/helicase Cas3